MGTYKTAGFTIIEVMLFLAVTGALAVGVLVGSGVAIGQQRYRDSVSSLQAFIQAQYSEATNMANARIGEESCTSAVVVAPPATVPSPQPRGTTDCLLLGRLLSINESGKEVTSAPVVAYRTSSSVPVEATDMLELTENYTLATSPLDRESYFVAWDATVVKPATTTPQPLSMLIIRSPLSGSVMTFVSEDPESDLNQLVQDGPNAAATDLCIRPSTDMFNGRQLAIRIGANATSQSAIELPTQSEGVCES